MKFVPATAVAHPNIALAKYWGKREGEGNYPAVPSLSVTLSGLTTTTRVAFRKDLEADVLVLNGEAADAEPLGRASLLLNRVRAAAGITDFAEVTSANDFPTAAGIASSASGFAALALAATRAAALDWDAAQISDLARQSSASAARSLFGGFVELELGARSARPIFENTAPCDQLDLRVLVCITGQGEAKKKVGSTDGMRTTASSSPYYAAWLSEAPKMYRALREALLAKDFVRVGELSEASALAMHASAIAAGVIYFGSATIEALAAVRALRAKGTPAFATMDAGPHVKVIARPEDAALVGTWMRAIPGVSRVIETRPGDAARIVTDVP